MISKNDIHMVSLGLAIVIVTGCVLTGPPREPDPLKPLYQGKIIKHKVSWPVPKTEEELEAYTREVESRAKLEEAAKFRRTCRLFNVAWMLGVPLGLGLGFYLRSKAAFVIAGLSVVMLPITYTASVYIPEAAPKIAIASVVFLALLLVCFAVWLAKRYKREGATLTEVVATVQRTKDKIWDNNARQLANRIQSEETKKRVQEIKANFPR